MPTLTDLLQGYKTINTHHPSLTVQIKPQQETGIPLGDTTHQHIKEQRTCSTLTMTIFAFPIEETQRQEFCLMLLSSLLKNSKYAPSIERPIIVRGQVPAELDQTLREACEELKVPSDFLSRRTYNPRFFAPQAEGVYQPLTILKSAMSYGG